MAKNNKKPEVGSDQLKVVAKKFKKYRPTPTQGVDPVVADIDDNYLELTGKINELQEDVRLTDNWHNIKRQELAEKLNNLTFKFYCFVGITVVVSIVINLYNWFA